MKKIFQEADDLLREYGPLPLNGEQMVLYSHCRKNVIPAFVYWLGGFGAHRFYMGDMISKCYGLGLLLIGILACFFTYWSVCYVLLMLVDMFFIIPLVNRNNLIIKKKLIENEFDLHDDGPYRLWDVFSIVYLALSIVLNIAIRHS